MSESQDASRESAQVATTRPQAVPRGRPRRLPPYAVVLENDNQHSVPYVIDALRKVFGYGWFKSLRLTMKVHFRGRAAVWTGPFETAEFKRDRMRSIGPDLYTGKPVNVPLRVRLEPLVS